jgi:hypothetical protein
MVHYAGQSVGLIKDIQPAARIVQRLKQETEQVMGLLAMIARFVGCVDN